MSYNKFIVICIAIVCTLLGCQTQIEGEQKIIQTAYEVGNLYTNENTKYLIQQIPPNTPYEYKKDTSCLIETELSLPVKIFGFYIGLKPQYRKKIVVQISETIKSGGKQYATPKEYLLQ